jgi:hypothetical protein
LNGCYDFTPPRPLPTEGPARCQKAVALPAPHVKASIIVGAIRRIVTVTPPTTHSTHNSLSILPKSSSYLATYLHTPMSHIRRNPHAYYVPACCIEFVFSALIACREALSASPAWIKCAQTCDQDAFHSASAFPVDVLAALHPGFAP